MAVCVTYTTSLYTLYIVCIQYAAIRVLEYDYDEI